MHLIMYRGLMLFRTFTLTVLLCCLQLSYAQIVNGISDSSVTSLEFSSVKLKKIQRELDSYSRELDKRVKRVSAALEEIGNYFAGWVGNLSGVSFNAFQRVAGGLEMHQINGAKYTFDAVDQIMLLFDIKTYGPAPYYGEVIQQYRWSKQGYNSLSFSEALYYRNKYKLPVK